MIPIHYFLALFAILASLMGCTQKAPPGSRQSVTSNNAMMIVDATPTTDDPIQIINHRNDPIVKPSVLIPTSIELSQPNGARDWKVLLKGADAEILYKIMAIKSDDTDRTHRELDAIVKAGKHLECYKLKKGSHQCEMILESTTGELKILNKKIHNFAADDVLSKLYHSDFLNLHDANTADKFSLGVESLTQEEAQKIFEGMTKVKPITLAADEVNGEGYQKKGVNVDCYQQFLKAKPKEAIYSCSLWFLNSTTGEFNKIE